MRFRLAEVLEDRGWTAYRLAREVEDAGGELTMRAAYRLARPGVAVRRVDLDVLDVLCQVLKTGHPLKFFPPPGESRR